ncbi:MAG: prealbumin-like fold domain-containing protein [Candidatus Ancillula trichonymphae]|nr:prealbumin-like fold domain-containing protein [Candidatus Ancillula trichonymphae]
MTDGLVQFKNLLPGYYILHEVSAPSKYYQNPYVLFRKFTHGPMVSVQGEQLLTSVTGRTIRASQRAVTALLMRNLRIATNSLEVWFNLISMVTAEVMPIRFAETVVIKIATRTLRVLVILLKSDQRRHCGQSATLQRQDYED